LLCEIPVERVFVLALNADLVEQGKCETVRGGAKALELLIIGPRFLLAEVVGRERQNLQPLVPVFFVYLLQVGILRCVPAEAGGVDQQEYRAAKLAQRYWLAVDVVERGIIDA
jgi:hypothetical protein